MTNTENPLAASYYQRVPSNLWTIVPKFSISVQEMQINCTNRCGALGAILAPVLPT